MQVLLQRNNFDAVEQPRRIELSLAFQYCLRIVGRVRIQAAVSMNDLFFSERVTRHEDAADLVGLALADLKRHSYAVVGLGPIDTRLHSYVRITFRIVQLHQCSAGLVHRDRRINIVFLQHDFSTQFLIGNRKVAEKCHEIHR